LAAQITRDVEMFTAFCAKDVRSANLTDKLHDAIRSILATTPDIVISTPAAASRQIESGALSLEKLAHVVLDEADLVLSYGYSDDLEILARLIPKAAQVTMMSATLTDELDTLKGIFSRQPTLLDLEEAETQTDKLTQFIVKCGEDEKFLLVYVIFKLQLLKGGKFLIFVADIDRSYRLKLFLEQFGIRSCILNSELPVNSRIHVVEEFNRGVYDIIIASDENNEMFRDEEKTGEKAEKAEDNDNQEDKKDDAESAEKEAQRSKKKKKAAKRDREYGVSRGIDFKNVAAVINFDLPTVCIPKSNPAPLLAHCRPLLTAHRHPHPTATG
jgi:ATP-dependent RNA helicase DDX56/DBP9